jgi:hypothetical protein
MDKNNSVMENLISFFSLVPMVLYTIVAILLTIIAFFSVWDALRMIAQMIVSWDFANGLLNVIYALLLTITIIVLLETVTVYFKTKHVEVRSLLIAGLTGMVRHVLIYNVGTVNTVTNLGTVTNMSTIANVSAVPNVGTIAPEMLYGMVALLAVLIAGIVLVKPEPQG